MNKLKALIIDDEYLARLEMEKLLNDYNNIEIVAQCASIDDSRVILQSNAIDLIFLDIDLGNENGFELLPEIHISTKVIFVTAFDKYAIRAFEVNALDYLLKPVNPERLKETISRISLPETQETKLKLKPGDNILVEKNKHLIMCSLDNILYIEARGDYTYISGSKNISGTKHRTIKDWIELLPEKMFVQTHRSYIVNINHILKLERKSSETYAIHFSGREMTIPVSRSFAKIVKNILDQ